MAEGGGSEIWQCVFVFGGGVVGGWRLGPLTSSEVCMGLASGRI